jgi:hypothetical protein
MPDSKLAIVHQGASAECVIPDSVMADLNHKKSRFGFTPHNLYGSIVKNRQKSNHALKQPMTHSFGACFFQFGQRSRSPTQNILGI